MLWNVQSNACSEHIFLAGDINTAAVFFCCLSHISDTRSHNESVIAVIAVFKLDKLHIALSHTLYFYVFIPRSRITAVYGIIKGI